MVNEVVMGVTLPVESTMPMPCTCPPPPAAMAAAVAARDPAGLGFNSNLLFFALNFAPSAGGAEQKGHPLCTATHDDGDGCCCGERNTDEGEGEG